VGLALGGMIPFANTFAALFLRAFEQIRSSVCYAETNVKMIVGYCGISDYKDGASHYSICDLSVMRSLPNMAVLSPADPVETAKMVPLAGDYDGPVYMRVSRAATPVIFDETYRPEIGKGTILREGKDAALIGTGVMVFRCLEAARALAKDGIDTRVVNIHTIKPLDAELIVSCAEETGAIVTAEEHSTIGGLGSAVAEAVSGTCPVPIERIGIRDTFCVTGPDPDSLLDHYGMAVSDLVSKVKKAVTRKGQRE